MQRCRRPSADTAAVRALGSAKRSRGWDGPNDPDRGVAIVRTGAVGPLLWREAVGISGTSGNPGWRALPRERARERRFVVSGGVGDPVTVELEEIVSRGH